MLYMKNEHFDGIYASLISCVNSPTPEEKWMCFMELDHLIANIFNMVYIDMTRYSFSKKLFSLQSGPPPN